MRFDGSNSLTRKTLPVLTAVAPALRRGTFNRKNAHTTYIPLVCICQTFNLNHCCCKLKTATIAFGGHRVSLPISTS